MATTPQIATREEWTARRLELLAMEKELNRRRDEVAARRRELPWVRVDKDYRFEGATGQATLTDLFEGRSQLLVYHFMFGPDWDEGCPSCSFWADSFDGVRVHLSHRDVTLAGVSRAPYPKLAAYRERMGWGFRWYSSAGGDFNFDFGVSFDSSRGPATYNYAPLPTDADELPGISAFIRDTGGEVFHTYSSYSRGLDPLNGAYQLLDLVPKGRDEASLEYTMQWLRRHDSYD